ncbi:MAG: alginate lyase family protein [Armatimonadota bacterium]
MYPDLITPKSFPDKLQDVSYDPFGLMPNVLPPHPRVFACRAEIERAKERIARGGWAKAAMDLLLQHCAEETEIPEALPVPADGKLTNSVLYYIERLALAFLLTGVEWYRERAIANCRKLAVAYPQWTITPGGGRATGGSLGESHFTHHLGRAYDLLGACGLSEEDDTAFRNLLFLSYEVSDLPTQPTCSNHNTWRLCGRLAVSAALGDRQGIHDALYGFEKNGAWRYGIIHQLRHDILPDGLHWERTPGYHYYTLMGFTEIADMAAHLGIDLWHAELPMQRQDDGHDVHRTYGPRGTKTLKVAFDAPFYLAFANRDLSLLSDTGLVNLRGVHVWGPIYEKAYEAYEDEKYAWLLNIIEREYVERKYPELPMSLQTVHSDLDFVRLKHESYPEGRFSLVEDCRLAPLARHEKGCTLFSSFGGAVLRSDPADEDAPAAFLFWGPHNAGHQSPAALHLDLHAGQPITSAPELGGYDDPDYLTWIRTTIAHNTVTVDEAPMFPYDFTTESIWECDHWRDTVSDGELLLFQPDADFSAMRARNENVYPGVLLDRTVIATKGYIIDAFRVISEQEHQYDWAAHCVGDIPAPADAQRIDLGDRRGYRHLTDACILPASDPLICWPCGKGKVALRLISPKGTQLILARDPLDVTKGYGGLAPLEPHASLIARARCRSTVFLALWQIGDGPLNFGLREGDAASELLVIVESTKGVQEWRLPFVQRPVTRQ